MRYFGEYKSVTPIAVFAVISNSKWYAMFVFLNQPCMRWCAFYLFSVLRHSDPSNIAFLFAYQIFLPSFHELLHKIPASVQSRDVKMWFSYKSIIENLRTT